MVAPIDQVAPVTNTNTNTNSNSTTNPNKPNSDQNNTQGNDDE